MKINRLELKNYRNLKDISLSPGEGVNIIYGDNAQGKTNLLEAVWLLSGAKSFRGGKDQEMILFGEEHAAILAAFYSQSREQTAEIRYEPKKTAWLNEIKLDSVTGFAGVFTAVVFSPAHLGLVKDGPAARRKFIDTSICQITPRYISILSQYQRVLLHRNTLLKDISYAPALLDTLDIWDDRLASLGAAVVRMRAQYTKKLREQAAEIYQGIAKGKESFTLFYEPNVENLGDMNDQKDIAKSIKEKLASSRGEDLRFGSTTYGPHRDDLQIQINKKSVRAFGSQGQQRSAVLALKLAESHCIADILGERPVVLLDDVMSELDRNRREYLLNHLNGNQVFVTCCDKNYFTGLVGGKVFYMQNGQIKEE